MSRTECKTEGSVRFCKVKIVLRCGNEHGYLGSRTDAIILNMFENNYLQLIQYEILEKLVTYIANKIYHLLSYNVLS